MEKKTFEFPKIIVTNFSSEEIISCSGTAPLEMQTVEELSDIKDTVEKI